MDKRKPFSPSDYYARVALAEECKRQDEFREKFRANLAKDVLLTILRGNGIPPLHSPQVTTSFCSLMVDYALQVTEYFMVKVFDYKERSGE